MCNKSHEVICAAYEASEGSSLEWSNDHKYDELKTHDTRVFVFCFLPVLLHPYQHYQAVQQLTSMIVLQWIYNSRRITPDVLSLSMQLEFHMNGLESVSSPSVGNPSYHYSHKHTMRMVFGPL